MMKRIRTLIFPLFLFAQIIGIPHISCQDFDIGFYFEPALSLMKSDDPMINSNGSVLGINFGGLGEYYFSENLSLASTFGFGFGLGGKLLYAYSGNFLPNSDLGNDQLNGNSTAFPERSTVTYRLGMLQIGTAPRVYFGDPEENQWWLSVPIIQIQVINRAIGDVIGPGLTLEDISIDKDINKFQLSWGIGFGRRFHTLDQNQIDISLSWRNGFTDLTEDESTKLDGGQIQAENSTAIMNSINFGATIIF